MKKLINYSIVGNKNPGNRLLLDTQVFIWLMKGNNNLPQDLIKILKNPQNTVLISVASVWEVVIKKMAGKLRVPRNIEESIKKAGFDILPIEIPHVLAVEKLPLIHKDPFDRLLIAQAKEEHCVLITDDPKIKKYNIKVLN